MAHIPGWTLSSSHYVSWDGAYLYPYCCAPWIGLVGIKWFNSMCVHVLLISFCTYRSLHPVPLFVLINSLILYSGNKHKFFSGTNYFRITSGKSKSAHSTFQRIQYFESRSLLMDISMVCIFYLLILLPILLGCHSNICQEGNPGSYHPDWQRFGINSSGMDNLCEDSGVCCVGDEACCLGMYSTHTCLLFHY